MKNIRTTQIIEKTFKNESGYLNMTYSITKNRKSLLEYNPLSKCLFLPSNQLSCTKLSKVVRCYLMFDFVDSFNTWNLNAANGTSCDPFLGSVCVCVSSYFFLNFACECFCAFSTLFKLCWFKIPSTTWLKSNFVHQANCVWWARVFFWDLSKGIVFVATVTLTDESIQLLIRAHQFHIMLFSFHMFVWFRLDFCVVLNFSQLHLWKSLEVLMALSSHFQHQHSRIWK